MWLRWSGLSRRLPSQQSGKLTFRRRLPAEGRRIISRPRPPARRNRRRRLERAGRVGAVPEDDPRRLRHCRLRVPGHDLEARRKRMDAVDRAYAVVDARVQRLHDAAVPVERRHPVRSGVSLARACRPVREQARQRRAGVRGGVSEELVRVRRPGSPGRTIGSSGAKWLRRQTLKKFVPCGAGGLDAEPAPATSSSPPAAIVVRSIIRPSFHCDFDYQEDESEPSEL